MRRCKQVDRPRRRHHHRVGRRRTATSSTTPRPRPSATSSSTCWSPSGPPSTRRCGSTSASRACPSRPRACFILVGRRHDGLDPQLVRRGGHDLQGRLGRRASTSRRIRSSQGAAQGRRHRLGPGQLHARRRRLGRHHQVAAARPAGPPRWSSSTSTTPTSRSSSGARPREERKARVLRDAGFDMDLDGADIALDPVPERQQLGARHRRVHAGRRRRRATGTCGPSPPARSSRPCTARDLHAPDRPGRLGVRRPGHAVRHHDQPLAHRGQHRPHQRLATRARSTCTSTTRRATWPASTC